MAQCFFAESVQGAGHLRREEEEENKALGRTFPCQDRSFSSYVPADSSHKTGYYLSIACDGHGGAPYFRSARGAELAVASMQEVLPPAIDGIAADLSEQTILSLVPSLLSDWERKVDAELAENPVTKEEYRFLELEDKDAADRYQAGEDLRSIYGATFLCCVVDAAGKFWFALQIGDGDIALHGEKGFFKPVPEDSRNYANVTTSLCDDNARNEFRLAFGREKIDAVLCSTDGVANSFAGEGQLFTFYERILRLFSSHDYGECLDKKCTDCDLYCRGNLARSELRAILPDLSRRGSGDDMTLAGFVDIDKNAVKKHLKARGQVEKGKAWLEKATGSLAGLYARNAERAFQNAAQNGYPEGFYQLGRMSMGKSRKDAIGYFTQAVDGDFDEAIEPLANLLVEEGKALQEAGDHKEAFKNFLRAAKYGVCDAQWAVSLYYGRPQDYKDCGVRQNISKALEWTFAAARQGHPGAECKIGKCYHVGKFIQHNEEASLEWYTKAADHGSQEAIEYLSQLKKSEVKEQKPAVQGIPVRQEEKSVPDLKEPKNFVPGLPARPLEVGADDLKEPQQKEASSIISAHKDGEQENVKV